MNSQSETYQLLHNIFPDVPQNQATRQSQEQSTLAIHRRQFVQLGCFEGRGGHGGGRGTRGRQLQ